MSVNKRAVLPGKGQQLVIDTTEIPKPKKGELLIKTHAVATNPVDWKIQKYGIFIDTFPFVLAADVAGEVVEVGEGETTFKKGDRVWSWTPTLVTKDSRFGGFQEYTLLISAGTGKVPSNYTYEQGSTLALPLATAIAGLYIYNNAPRPSSPPKRATPAADAPVLYVSGGASAVGSAAVQLGALAGLRVISTASPKNFDLVRSFGATEVFDYRDAELVQKVKAAIPAGQKVTWAYDAVSEAATLKASVAVLEGQGNLITVLPPSENFDGQGAKVSSIFAGVLYQPANAEVLSWYVSYVSQAAEAGVFIPLTPEVKGTSLEDAQKVLDYHASGQVSATKPVIKLA